MSFQFLTYAVADRIATITVNRPDKLNALNDATMAELGRAVDQARGHRGAESEIAAGREGAGARWPAGLRTLRVVAEAGGRGGQRIRARRRL
jgi:enoyl-CoA hydratase